MIKSHYFIECLRKNSSNQGMFLMQQLNQAPMHGGAFSMLVRLLLRGLSGELVIVVQLGFIMITGCLVRLFLRVLIYQRL